MGSSLERENLDARDALPRAASAVSDFARPAEQCTDPRMKENDSLPWVSCPEGKRGT